jgi:hypothetical protein
MAGFSPKNGKSGMASAVEMGPAPVQYSAASEEPFLRWTIFVAFVGLLSGSGALVPAYYAITGAPDVGGLNGTRLMLFWSSILLAIGLVCLIHVRIRVLDLREGPRCVFAVVTRMRRNLLGLGRQVEVDRLSEDWVPLEHTREKLQVSKQDFARIHIGGHLRFLWYPRTGAYAASECYDMEAQELIRFSPDSPAARYASILSGLGNGSHSFAAGLVGLLLVLLLVPLWLLAYLIAHIVARHARRRNPIGE